MHLRDYTCGSEEEFIIVPEEFCIRSILSAKKKEIHESGTDCS
jgi:hypothetical protein